MSRLAIIPLFFISFSAYAQLTLGVKGGLNVSDIVINNVNDPDAESDFNAKAGLHAGVFAVAVVGPRTGLSAEIQYSNKGVRALSDVNLHYVAVPVLIRYHLSEKFIAEGGPELAYLVAARSRIGNMNSTYDNKLDLGLDAGIQYVLTESLSLGLRFNAGMSSVIRNASHPSSTNKLKYQNRVLQLSVAWTLRRIDQ